VVCVRFDRACNVWSWVPVVAPHVGGVLGAWIYIVAIGAHLRSREQPVDTDTKLRELEVLSGWVDSKNWTWQTRWRRWCWRSSRPQRQHTLATSFKQLVLGRGRSLLALSQHRKIGPTLAQCRQTRLAERRFGYWDNVGRLGPNSIRPTHTQRTANHPPTYIDAGPT